MCLTMARFGAATAGSDLRRHARSEKALDGTTACDWTLPPLREKPALPTNEVTREIGQAWGRQRHVSKDVRHTLSRPQTTQHAIAPS